MRGAGWESDHCRAPFVRPGRFRGAGSEPRHRSMWVYHSTACAGSLAQLLTYGLAVRALFGGSLATSHASLATAFLIYGTGIRNAAKSLKT
jgi:hypothetical protein